MTTATLPESPPSAPDVDTALSKLVRVADLAIAEITFRFDNHRAIEIDDEELQSLADSIKDRGQLNEIWVTTRHDKPSYDLVAGHRRLKAVEINGHKTIRAKIFDNLTDAEVLELRAIENLQRRELNIMEQCVAVEQAYENNGLNLQRVAHSISQETAWVRDRLYLASRICPDVRAVALSGVLGIGHLRQLAKIGDKADQYKVCQWGVHQSLGGELRVRSVDWFKKQVQDIQRSLRIVPWELDQRVGKLRPCVGCPHNSQTDPALFEVADPEADRGQCSDDSCFKAKQAEAEKAVKLTISKLRKAKHEPTADNVDQAKPAWLKRGTAQRQARQALASKDGTKPPASSSKASNPAASPLAKAVRRFKKALRVWEGQYEKEVGKLITARPALVIASMCEPEFTYRHWDNGNDGSYSAASKPGAYPKLNTADRKTIDKYKTMLAIDSDAIPGPIRKLLKSGRSATRRTDCTARHPMQLIALAEVLGVEITPPPAWQDYAPGSQTKKKSKVTKVAKKKVLKKKPRKPRASKKGGAR